MFRNSFYLNIQNFVYLHIGSWSCYILAVKSDGFVCSRCASRRRQHARARRHVTAPWRLTRALDPRKMAREEGATSSGSLYLPLSTHFRISHLCCFSNRKQSTIHSINWQISYYYFCCADRWEQRTMNHRHKLPQIMML